MELRLSAADGHSSDENPRGYHLNLFIVLPSTILLFCFSCATAQLKARRWCLVDGGTLILYLPPLWSVYLLSFSWDFLFLASRLPLRAQRPAYCDTYIFGS